jgi:hypothetical protein
LIFCAITSDGVRKPKHFLGRLFISSAILGKTAKDHWKVMKVTHFGPAQKAAGASS